MDSTNRPTHLADLVEAAAARHADHPALIDAVTGDTLTWAELDATVSAEARRLAAAGVVAGDRVVIGCAGVPALAVAVLGALRADAVAVPVAAEGIGVAGAPTVAEVVARCTPRVLVADGAEPGSADVAVVGPPDLSARGERVATTGGGENVALLLHTTAGRAVCLSHRAVLANRAQAAALRPAPVTPVDRVLLTVPLFHAYGLAAGLFQICWAGATTVLPAPGRPDADGLADTVARHRVSALAGVPSTFKALLEVPPDRLRTALAGLRLCTCGGGPLPRPWAAAFHEATGHRIVVGYGLTQAGPVVTSTPLAGVAEPGSVGRPLPGIELRLVDGDGRPTAVLGTAAPAQDDEAQAGAPVDAERPGAPGVVATGPAGPGAGTSDVRGTSRLATDVRAAAERGVAEFRAAAERGVAEFRAAAERAATEVRVAVRAGDPVGDMIDDAQDVEGAPAEADIGRIALRGPNLFSGYWPGCTDGPDADGWFVTSDMGFLDGSGALHLVDRSSDLVVVSGFTVYPHEVERVLDELPGVAEAAVIGVPDERTGQAVRAVVVRASGGPGPDAPVPDAPALDADAVRAHCRARLARFKVPAQVVFVAELPRTPAGRLARHLLADRPAQP